MTAYSTQHKEQCPCFKQIWKVGKVGKVGRVGKVGKVGKEGQDGTYVGLGEQRLPTLYPDFTAV